MESEQTNLKLKVEEDRKAAMRQIADGFDQAIGKIVQTVSTASSELELSAGSLTTTAEVTQALSATVTSASEQSSANAQSAAAASEEMASSVSEIGRQGDRGNQRRRVRPKLPATLSMLITVQPTPAPRPRMYMGSRGRDRARAII